MKPQGDIILGIILKIVSYNPQNEYDNILFQNESLSLFFFKSHSQFIIGVHDIVNPRRVSHEERKRGERKD